eukprot:gene8420-245_t
MFNKTITKYSKIGHWKKPNGIKTGIFVLNSLTKEKNELMLTKPFTSWYLCGPTVYDYSHLGHARTYIGFDIVRRILENYFQINLKTVINITDIDDKIIRKGYLKQLELKINQLKNSKSFSIQNFEEKLSNDSKFAEKKLETTEILEMIEQLNNMSQNEEKIDDQFSNVAKHYETLFWKDMRELNVKMPDSITRVTEYIPEIIKFIENIIKRGYAYESNGSVYFDTKNYSNSHVYCKLEPQSISNIEKSNESEEDFNKKIKNEKKSIQDFVLWKKSNEKEPSWNSPWGLGRPGWHIECSAMIGASFGDSLDIHCGGIDLRFPHHDNEIAQSEACFECDQWVNYFLHTGQLMIEGRSMSKSKKNFIKIQELLEKYSSKQIRMLFLLHKFNDIIEYSNKSMEFAVNTEKIFTEFFYNVQVVLREKKEQEQKWNEDEIVLHELFLKKKNEIHDALCDNFDTPLVIRILQDIVKKTNTQMNNIKKPLLIQISEYITNLFKIFGLIEDSIGWSKTTNDNYSSYLNVLSEFRDDIRTIAKKNKQYEILNLCDELRDERLKSVGVRLEDVPGKKSIWKLVE